jgi:xanthine dehydrogenase accessory factor/xanthine dehydrogenase large subunit
VTALAAVLRDLLARGEPAALVEVTALKGSAPREVGARMLVAARAIHGTIGGGQLEWEATRRARALLASDEPSIVMEVPLGPEIGQCCGGFVSLRLSRADDGIRAELEAIEQAEGEGLPLVLLFGAGHVGKALAAALAPLPFRVRWIDGRAGEFPDPPIEGPEVVVTERALAEVDAAPADAACLVLTHSHALDSMICAAVLQRGDFAYLGLIGSRTKRVRFERGFRDLGIPEERIARLVCPIGGARLKDKRPEVIAALTAAELLQALAEPTANGQHRATGEAA